MISVYGKTSIYSKTSVGTQYQPAFANNTPTTSSAVGVYSLRKVIPEYTGYACRVVRSSDGYQKDIGFDSNGNLDETALSAFAGNGNGFYYSDTFDNTAIGWTHFNITVATSATTNPFGGASCWLISEAATNTVHNIASLGIAAIAGINYTMSIYLKKGSGATAPDIIQLALGNLNFAGNLYANFNISTGVVTATAAGATASIENAGNGWWRCILTGKCTSSGNPRFTPVAFVNNNPTAGYNPNYTGSTTSNVFVSSATLNAGTSALTYTATTTTALGTLTVNRWYEQTSKHFENLYTYSEEFDNGYWGKTGVTVTANATASPIGIVNADRIICTAGSSVHNFNPNSGTSFTGGLHYTVSVYLKKGIGSSAPDIIQLACHQDAFGTNVYANFNISTGVVTAQSNCVATIVKSQNGYYRCFITALCTSTIVAPTYPVVFVNNNPSATFRPVYNATVNEDVYAWGAQLNTTGASSDYIRVIASTVTYSRAVFQGTVANQPTLVNYGTILKEGGKPIVTFDGSNDYFQTNVVPYWLNNTAISVFSVQKINTVKTANYLMGTNSGTAQSGFHLGFVNSTTFRFSFFGSDADYTLTQQAVSRELINGTYKNTGSELYKNATLVNTSANPTLPLLAISVMNVGCGYSTSGQFFAGGLQELLIFNTDMSSYRTTIESNINSYYSIY